MIKRHELNMYGLPVIMRHDYEDPEILGKIRSYVDCSVKAVEEFITNVPGSENFKTFVDIGCGDGYVIEKVKDRFEQAIGVDLFIPESAQYGNLRWTGPTLVKGDWYELSKIVPDIDVAFVNHSLEHAANAFALMQQISMTQKKGSVLFIAIPDADYPWAYSMTSSTTHFSIFNRGFLQELLQRFGYRACIEERCFRPEKGELWAFAVKQYDGLPE